MKPISAIGFLGSTLDAGDSQSRRERWRPTVAVCQHGDLLVERFDILYQKRFASLLKRVSEDIKCVSHETEVVAHEIEFSAPRDFEDLFSDARRVRFEFALQEPPHRR